MRSRVLAGLNEDDPTTLARGVMRRAIWRRFSLLARGNMHSNRPYCLLFESLTNEEIFIGFAFIAATETGCHRLVEGTENEYKGRRVIVRKSRFFRFCARGRVPPSAPSALLS